MKGHIDAKNQYVFKEFVEDSVLDNFGCLVIFLFSLLHIQRVLMEF